MPPNIKELIVKPTLFGSPSLYTLQAIRPMKPVSSMGLSDSGGGKRVNHLLKRIT